MLKLRDATVLSLLGLLLLMAWPSPARAETKHPAEEKGIKSTSSDVETNITFVNRSGQTIKVYWIDYEGRRKLYETAKNGDTCELRTYLTHPWLITDEGDNAWYVYFPDAQPRTVEVVAPEKK
jgi:hypothetical protein